MSTVPPLFKIKSKLFLNGIEDIGAPEVGDRLHIAYTHELTGSQKPQTQITVDDAKRWAQGLPENAECCIDLEPGTTPELRESFAFSTDFHSRPVVLRESERLGRLIKGVNDVRPDLKIGALYFPLGWNIYRNNAQRAKWALDAMGALRATGARIDTLHFDVYRQGPDAVTQDPVKGAWVMNSSDIAWHQATASIISDIKQAFNLPLRVWMSFVRHLYSGPDNIIPVSLWRADLCNYASRLGPDDKIVTWKARAAPLPENPEQWVAVNWDNTLPHLSVLQDIETVYRGAVPQ